MRQPLRQHHLSSAAALAATVVLSGCADAGAGLAERPLTKPAIIPVTLEGPVADSTLLGSVSTKSGELAVLEPDGTVSRAPVASARSRAALASTESLSPAIALQEVLVEDDSILPEALPAPPRAQDEAIKAFAARSTALIPANLPDQPGEIRTAVELRQLGSDKDLIEVRIETPEGLDDDAGFAYATCTLAGWAKASGVRYARPIHHSRKTARKIRSDRAVFLLSKTRPLGLRLMETEMTLRDCRSRNIPTGGVVAAASGDQAGQTQNEGMTKGMVENG